MKIIISEENHGFIGTSKDYQSAINFLLNEDWITEDSKFWDDIENKFKTLNEMYGNDWQNVIRSFTLDKFNDVFVDYFYLKEV